MRKIIVIFVVMVFGCTNAEVALESKTPNDNVIEVPQKEVPLEATAESKTLFTPLIALEAALSEPLDFVGRVKKFDKLNQSYEVCLWRNSKVFVRTNYCTKDRSVNRTTVGVDIYSSDGQMVELYSELKPSASKTIYQARGNMVYVRYSDFSSLDAMNLFHLGMSVDQYVDFWLLMLEKIRVVISTNPSEIRGLDFDYPYCREVAVIPDKKPDRYTPWSEYPLGIGCWEMSEVNTKAITEIGNQFLNKTPPEQWYTFLNIVKEKYVEHGWLKNR